MSATINEAFAQIAERHNCCNVELSYNRLIDGHNWTATLHWTGPARSGIPCVFGFGDTPAQAMGKAIANMRADREPFIVAPLDSKTLVEFETPQAERDLDLCDVRPTATGVML
jgi:hypothetical protein